MSRRAAARAFACWAATALLLFALLWPHEARLQGHAEDPPGWSYCGDAATDDAGSPLSSDDGGCCGLACAAHSLFLNPAAPEAPSPSTRFRHIASVPSPKVSVAAAFGRGFDARGPPPRL